MKIDLSGYEFFLKRLSNEIHSDDLFTHPAYMTLLKHARHFNNGFSHTDVDAAIRKEPSPFYGLKHIDINRKRIDSLISIIKDHKDKWCSKASSTLNHLLPDENTHSITIYPILGYDMGIGMDDTVCMNLNVELYLDHPEEFFYFIIHECIHVLYERSHRIPPLRLVTTPPAWKSMLLLMLQNEGFAVYAPLKLRSLDSHLTFTDYPVIMDKKHCQQHIGYFFDTLKWFDEENASDSREWAEKVFGNKRLTYRVGCEMLRRIEAANGMDAVSKAFYLSPERFFHHFHYLLY